MLRPLTSCVCVCVCVAGDGHWWDPEASGDEGDWPWPIQYRRRAPVSVQGNEALTTVSDCISKTIWNVLLFTSLLDFWCLKKIKLTRKIFGWHCLDQSISFHLYLWEKGNEVSCFTKNNWTMWRQRTPQRKGEWSFLHQVQYLVLKGHHDGCCPASSPV